MNETDNRSVDTIGENIAGELLSWRPRLTGHQHDVAAALRAGINAYVERCGRVGDAGPDAAYADIVRRLADD